MIRRLLAVAALTGVLVGGVLRLLGEVGAAETVWAASAGVMLVPLSWSVARTLWRRDLGVDAIALVAMVSALATGEIWPPRSWLSCLRAATRSRSTRAGGRGGS